MIIKTEAEWRQISAITCWQKYQNQQQQRKLYSYMHEWVGIKTGRMESLPLGLNMLNAFEQTKPSIGNIMGAPMPSEDTQQIKTTPSHFTLCRLTPKHLHMCILCKSHFRMRFRVTPWGERQTVDAIRRQIDGHHILPVMMSL